MRVCVSYVLLPSIGADVPAHSQSPLMRETTVLCEVVCEAEPVETPNGADFALRRDDELCVHEQESRIGVFDASESDGRTRHARRGRLHSRCRRRLRRPTSKSASFDQIWQPDLGPISVRSRGLDSISATEVENYQ